MAERRGRCGARKIERGKEIGGKREREREREGEGELAGCKFHVVMRKRRLVYEVFVFTAHSLSQKHVQCV